MSTDPTNQTTKPDYSRLWSNGTRKWRGLDAISPEEAVRAAFRTTMSEENMKLVDISGSIEGETEKAYRFHDGTQAVWLPKSQVEWDPDGQTMAMPEWLAKDKELI